MALNRDLTLNSGMRCVKYMLIIVSFMFAITAMLLIMVGSTIQAIFGDFREFLDDHFWSPPALLIAIGFIMLFVAALGAYGAVRESVLLINLYGVCLFLVFILEVAAAISAIVMQTEVKEMLHRTMNDSFSQYDSNEYMRTTIDLLQSGFECCGVESPADWKTYWNPNTNSTNGADDDTEIFLPPSCCGQSIMGKCEIQYDYGCYRRVTFIISQSTMLIATGATTVAFVQILGVLCAFMLAKTLRRNKSIREARRWQFQQSLGVLMSGENKMPPTIGPTMTGYTQLEKTERFTEHDPITYTPNSPSVN